MHLHPFCGNCNSEYHIENFDKECPGCGIPLGSRSAKMSKSLGNTVAPGEMVENSGADTVRLFILFGANPEAGMDWSDNAVLANHKQVLAIIDAIDIGLNFGKSPSEIDNWLLARLRVHHTAWQAAMDSV